MTEDNFDKEKETIVNWYTAASTLIMAHKQRYPNDFLNEYVQELWNGLSNEITSQDPKVEKINKYIFKLSRQQKNHPQPLWGPPRG